MIGSIDELIENEWHIVRHSGEIPEIAYNSAIYFLTRAKDGPRVRLSEQHRQSLKNAAAQRFGEIVLRDLDHNNLRSPSYRGVERSRVNYARFCAFCRRQQVDGAPVRQMAADALIIFLKTELQQLKITRRPSVIDCTYLDLQAYAAELGIKLEEGFAELAHHCQ